jgi:DNA-binding NarL/FixJ family response regulator
MAALPVANRRIRVLLADDHPVVRRMVPSTFQAHPHIEVVAEAEERCPGCRTSKRNKAGRRRSKHNHAVYEGISGGERNQKHVPEPAIVILSTHADRHFVEEGRKLGGRAYVSKSKVGAALVRAVEAAVKGEDFVIME